MTLVGKARVLVQLADRDPVAGRELVERVTVPAPVVGQPDRREVAFAAGGGGELAQGIGRAGQPGRPGGTARGARRRRAPRRLR